jgi:hypothetical protein
MVKPLKAMHLSERNVTVHYQHSESGVLDIRKPAIGG